MLLFVALEQCLHRRLRLRGRNARLQTRGYAHETHPAHQSLLRQTRRLEWFVRKNLRVTSEPRNRQGRQDADDCAWHSVECDAAAEDRRVGVEPLTPETLRHHYNVSFALFLRQKIAAENRMDAKQFEIVGGDVAAK